MKGCQIVKILVSYKNIIQADLRSNHKDETLLFYNGRAYQQV